VSVRRPINFTLRPKQLMTRLMTAVWSNTSLMAVCCSVYAETIIAGYTWSRSRLTVSTSIPMSLGLTR